MKLALYVVNHGRAVQVACIDSDKGTATSIEVNDSTRAAFLLMYDFLASILGLPLREGAIVPNIDGNYH